MNYDLNVCCLSFFFFDWISFFQQNILNQFFPSFSCWTHIVYIGVVQQNMIFHIVSRPENYTINLVYHIVFHLLLLGWNRFLFVFSHTQNIYNIFGLWSDIFFQKKSKKKNTPSYLILLFSLCYPMLHIRAYFLSFIYSCLLKLFHVHIMIVVLEEKILQKLRNFLRKYWERESPKIRWRLKHDFVIYFMDTLLGTVNILNKYEQ